MSRFSAERGCVALSLESFGWLCDPSAVLEVGFILLESMMWELKEVYWGKLWPSIDKV